MQLPVKIFKVAGVLIFIILIAGAFFFAEGYQLDTKNKEIVKKSVILLENLPDGANVTINGNPAEFAVNHKGELRVIPGEYNIRIEMDGAFPWEKWVSIREDEIVRFAKILMIQKDGFGSGMKPIEPLGGFQFTSIDDEGVMFINNAKHAGKYFKFSGKGKFEVLDLPGIKGFSKIVYSRNIVYGLSSGRGEVIVLGGENKQTNIGNRNGFIDIIVNAGRLFATNSSGEVFIFDEKGPEKFFFKITEKINGFERVAKVGGNNMFIFNGERGKYLVLADGDGNILYQQKNVNAAFLSKEKLAFIQNGVLSVYDFKKRELVSAYEMKKFDINAVYAIEGTFNIVVLRRGGRMDICDNDFDNCHGFANTRSTANRWVGADGRRVFAVIDGKITLFDFEEYFELQRFLENLVSKAF